LIFLTFPEALQANGSEFTAWDDAVSGFGMRVRPSGAKSYVVVYRAGAGRGAPVRRYTIGAVGKLTPESARARTKVILGAVAHGHDPANQKAAERGTPTVTELADRFMANHVRTKRKAGTAEFYRDILDRIVKPAIGTTKADKLTRLQVGKLHSPLPSQSRAGRLREILHLRWEHVDIEPGCLFLPGSKSGRKTVVLNAPALSVLAALQRVGPYVVPGNDPEQPVTGCRHQAGRFDRRAPA
jgi:integrase